jgi:hypothetical protein
MKTYLRVIFLMLCSSLMLLNLTGCHRSHMIFAWEVPSTKLTVYKNVLVVALMGDKDVPLRQDMELDMIEALNKHGVKACSAFEKFGATSFEDDKDPNGDLRKWKDNNYDAVVYIVLLDRDQEKYYVNRAYHSNRNGYNAGYFNTYNGYPNYYNQSAGRIYTSGYYKKTVKYSIEVNVFDFQKDEAIYSAETKTNNPKHLETMTAGVTQMIMDDMVKKKMIDPLKK